MAFCHRLRDSPDAIRRVEWNADCALSRASELHSTPLETVRHENADLIALLDAECVERTADGVDDPLELTESDETELAECSIGVMDTRPEDLLAKSNKYDLVE